jgi:hypothetical protein
MHNTTMTEIPVYPAFGRLAEMPRLDAVGKHVVRLKIALICREWPAKLSISDQ